MNYRQPSHNNASSAPFSIFPRRFFYDLISSALPSPSTRIRWGWSWADCPPFLRDGLPFLAFPWAMSDVYDSIRAYIRECFFQSIVLAEIHLALIYEINKKILSCPAHTIYRVFASVLWVYQIYLEKYSNANLRFYERSTRYFLIERDEITEVVQFMD